LKVASGDGRQKFTSFTPVLKAFISMHGRYCTMNVSGGYMAKNRTEEAPTPKSIAAYVKSAAARARKAQEMQHEEAVVTREADHNGHHIVVRTHYEVEVDGKPLTGHLAVSDSGLVHYHPIPNLSYSSALDMVRKIIDVYPDDFGPGVIPGGHTHQHPAAMHRNPRKQKVSASKTAQPSKKGRR
jgi:hypothetical protein